MLIATALAVVAAGCDAPIETETVEGTAILRLDLPAGIARADREGRFAEAPLPDTIAAQLDSLRAALAHGRDAAALRSQVGTTILGPLEEILAPADRWIVRSARSEAVPGPLATLAAWSLPWGDGEPAGVRHVLRLDWPDALQPLVPRSRKSAGSTVLLVAPFRTGTEPRADDPDTLRAALAGAAARVEMIPRNDVSAVSLRRTLERDTTALLWFRGTSSALADLRGSFGAWPAAVAWSLPGDTTDERLALLPATLASGGEGPATVLLPMWAIPETAVARVAREWLDTWAGGQAADVALRTVRRTQWKERRPAREWASFALLGDPSETDPPDRTSWLRRLQLGGN